MAPDSSALSRANAAAILPLLREQIELAWLTLAALGRARELLEHARCDLPGGCTAPPASSATTGIKCDHQARWCSSCAAGWVVVRCAEHGGLLACDRDLREHARDVHGAVFDRAVDVVQLAAIEREQTRRRLRKSRGR